MHKLTNIVFIVIAGILCSCILGNIAISCIVPSYNIPQKSYLEGREYQDFPILNTTTITNGSFQTQTEQYLADRIPNRVDSLVCNATLQRNLIAFANIPFRYEAYPTFFGSGFTYSPSDGATAELPYSTATFTKEKLTQAARPYASVIQAHPEFNWVFAMPDRPATFADSHAARLSYNHADYSWFRRHLLDHLPQDCAVVDLSYSDLDSFYENYYITDHHWQVMGATKAYGSIIAALGGTPTPLRNFYIVYDGPFWGSAARNGICTASSDNQCYDTKFRQNSLRVFVDGTEKDSSWLSGSNGTTVEAYRPVDTFANFYAYYFHNDVGELVLQNDSIETGELLIVGDSFTNCMERFFATNYHKVHVLDLRHYPGTLEDYLFANGDSIDDAVFIISAAAITSNEILTKL